jgi:hypothetical protein
MTIPAAAAKSTPVAATTTPVVAKYTPAEIHSIIINTFSKPSQPHVTRTARG